MSQAPALGRPLRRLEDPRLITGRGRYAGDVALPGLLHLAFIRSPQPHARILAIELDAVRAMPGVVAAWTAGDLPESARHLSDWVPPALAGHPRPVLAEAAVHYVGEPMAVVIAETAYQAADAADAVHADLEPLPAAGDAATAAQAGAGVLEGEPANALAPMRHGHGDIEAAFAGAEVVVGATLAAARVAGAAMEPRAGTAIREGDGILMWTSTQSVHGVREQVARALGLNRDRVTVVAEDVGGGFGPKGATYPEEILVALAAWRLGRPARFVNARSEDTSATSMGHGADFDLELAAGADGVLRGLRGRVRMDAGPYDASGLNQGGILVPHMMSAYRVPAIEIEVEVVRTNAVTTAYVRGGGRPLGNFAIERLMDRLAARLGIDPAEVRRRNLIPPQAMPYDTGFPAGRGTVVYDSGDYPRSLATALDLLGWDGLRARRGPQPDGRLLGLGIACCVESSGFGSGEPARLRVDREGIAQLWVGSTPQGQGHQTMAAQMLATRLGWPLERIRVTAGDTRGTGPAFVTAGSRSAIHVGNAVAVAARSMRRALLERASEVLEADPADLDLEDGMVRVVGAPARSIPATEAVPPEGLEVVEAWETPKGTSYSSGVHAAAVLVDPETGAIEVTRYVIVHDTGNTINPRMLEGQLHGGLAHGIGYALFEEAVYRPEGGFVSASFLDYAIPGAPEMAMTLLTENAATVTDFNPEGIKGVGESGTVPVPATIAGAVEDALRSVNPAAVVDRIPITPERVLAQVRRP